MSDSIKPKFWTCHPDAEHMLHCEIADAVDEFLNDRGPSDPLPNELEVYGYAPMVPDRNLAADRVLEFLLEDINSEYGNPDEAFVPTESMKAAAAAFVDAFLSEYRIWACDKVTTLHVDPRDYASDEEEAL